MRSKKLEGSGYEIANLLEKAPGTRMVVEVVNALRACVYIYIRQLSSFRAPTLWFIDLTVTPCHIHFPEFDFFFSRENG